MMTGDTKTQHTPTPWFIDAEMEGHVFNVDGRLIAVCRGYDDSRGRDRYDSQRENEANAEFIVTACNAHDDLLATCRGIVAVGTCDPDFNRMWVVQKLSAAIAKAKHTL